jgi:phosphomannomutase
LGSSLCRVVFGQGTQTHPQSSRIDGSGAAPWRGAKLGDRIEDRGSQITFSGLGQHATLDVNQAWDPDFAKRKRLQAAPISLLPDFAVRVGGLTLIHITRKGIDTAYGMAKLVEASGVPADEMIFIGYALDPGRNDYAVHEAGIDTICVRDVAETIPVTEAITLCLK